MPVDYKYLNKDCSWRRGTIYLPDDIKAVIDGYRETMHTGGQSYAIIEIIKRYRKIVIGERGGVRELITPDQFAHLCKHAGANDADTIPGSLLAMTSDPVLRSAIRSMTTAQQFALVDMIEEARNIAGANDDLAEQAQTRGSQ